MFGMVHAEPEVAKEVKQKLELGAVKFEVHVVVFLSFMQILFTGGATDWAFCQVLRDRDQPTVKVLFIAFPPFPLCLS